MRIADCLEEATFSKGDYIIRQGDAGDIFYIVQNGKVKVTHNQVGKQSFDAHFKILTKVSHTLFCFGVTQSKNQCINWIFLTSATMKKPDK